MDLPFLSVDIALPIIFALAVSILILMDLPFLFKPVLDPILNGLGFQSLF